MAIFRNRALDAANRTAAIDAPLLLPRPAMGRRWRGNLSQLRNSLLPQPGNTRRVSTPEIRQQDPTECGAVCLAIVLRHHGRHVPLSQLRRACGVSRDGSDAANLVRAALLFGLKAKGFKKGLEALKNVELPAILFWNFEHFLVLEGLDGERFWLNDPAIGRRCVGLEEFDRSYTGVVLTLQPGDDFSPSPPPPGAAQQLQQRLQLQSPPLRQALLVAVVAAALVLSLPVLLWTLLPGQPPTWLLLAACGLLALALLPLAQALSRRLQRQGSNELQQRLLALPDWVIQQRFSADLSNRLNLVPQLGDFVRGELGLSAALLLACLLWGLVLLPLNPGLSLLLWAGVAVSVWASHWDSQQQQSLEAQQRMAARRPTSILQGGLHDPDTLKASALERDLFGRWSGLQTLAARERLRLDYRRALLGWIPQLLGWGLPLLLVGAAALTLPPPQLVPVQLVALGLAWAQLRGQRLLRRWTQTRAAIEGIETVLEQPADPLLQEPAPNAPGAEATSTPSTAPTRPAAAIAPAAAPAAGSSLTLENLSFGYVPVLPPLIEGLNLEVSPGQRIALVGGSGSGKSTLGRLIAGLLQPTGGGIQLDGRPLLAWPRHERLRRVAMVQQGMPLLSCSLRDNLSYWNPSISERELEQACAAAAILERIRQLPKGFDTLLQQGGHNLSGGERQRLQIAQALLQRPSLLILDEATSALDAATEEQIEASLRQLGCTQIVIAHRLSTIRDADLILVLERGVVVQRGRHDDLLQQDGSPYRQLLLQGLAGDAMLGAPTPAPPRSDG